MLVPTIMFTVVATLSFIAFTKVSLYLFSKLFYIPYLIHIIPHTQTFAHLKRFVCRFIISTVAAEQACPKLRRSGPQEPGRTLTYRLQLSRQPWVQPQEACRINSLVRNTMTTRCSLFNRLQTCQSLGKIQRTCSRKTVNAPEIRLFTHIWVSCMTKSLLC